MFQVKLAKPSPPAAISQQRQPGVALVVFFLIFLGIGLGVEYFAFVKPVWQIRQASHWPAAPCTIISSRVTSHRGSKSTSYSADIFYRYIFNGHLYGSHIYAAYDTTGGRSSATNALVKRYRPGTHATCYVNPSNPRDALLNRSWNWSLAPMALFPLIFVLVGAGGALLTLRSIRRGRNGAISGGSAQLRQDSFASGGPSTGVATPVPMADSRMTGPLTLRASDGPIKSLVLALLLALFWNGIVSVFVGVAWNGWAKGHGDLCMTAFMLPFVAVGVGLIIWVFYRILALFNPRPELTIDHRAIPLGSGAQVKWKFSGRVDRISRLRVSLEGREEATYQRGTNTHTDRHVFHRTILGDVTRPIDIASGKAQLTIPADTIHTFTAKHNKIIWSLKLHGEIMGWPDVREEFPIEITVME